MVPEMIPTKVTVIPPEGEPVTSDVLLPRVPRLEDLKPMLTRILDGGRPEHVAVLHGDRRADMFVDEDGHEKGLPRNEAATAIYRAASLQREPKVWPESLPYIVGTAILFGRSVWF